MTIYTGPRFSQGGVGQAEYEDWLQEKAEEEAATMRCLRQIYRDIRTPEDFARFRQLVTALSAPQKELGDDPSTPALVAKDGSGPR